MTLGEKATLLITGYAHPRSPKSCERANANLINSDYAYGAQGFPGLIPANATLVL